MAVLELKLINIYLKIKCNLNNINMITINARPQNSESAAGADHVQGRQQLIKLLKDAFCEEMMAWYQYIIVAPFLKGNERTEIAETFEELAEDELKDHGAWLLERINLLGGNCEGIQSPSYWNQVATHKYIMPNMQLTVEGALDQNIKAERGAIETYTKLEKLTREVDPVSNLKIKEILGDEEEHLQHLLEYKEDLKYSR